MDITEDVNIVAIVNGCKEILTKKGDRMAYITLEDTKGIVEAIVFPDLYSKNLLIIKGDRPLFINGSVEKSEDGSAKIKVKNITLFDEIIKEMGKIVKINLQCDVFNKEDLKKMRDVLIS
jgi:DNA polymerase-3 subunit alpha